MFFCTFVTPKTHHRSYDKITTRQFSFPAPCSGISHPAGEGQPSGEGKASDEGKKSRISELKRIMQTKEKNNELLHKSEKCSTFVASIKMREIL